MANEITLNLRFRVEKGFIVDDFNPGTSLVTMSGSVAVSGVQTIGTTADVLVMSNVSSACYAYFRNTDTTNFVELGTGTGGSFVAFAKLKAGESAIIRLGTNAPTARANTASVNLLYAIYAD